MPKSENTYSSLIANFADFLTVAIHTILYTRHCYPSDSFISAKKYNFPVHQSRHPKVSAWITDAVSSVQNELLLGTVDRVAVMIISDGGEPLERFLFDVSRFPVVEKGDWYTPIQRESSESEVPDQEPTQIPPTINLQEQFRAVLAKLSICNTTLKPIPAGCTFTLAIELKEESNPPMKHPQAWMPVEPSLQREIGVDEDGFEEVKKGESVGGVKTLPVRTVEAGEMCFEMWIEEGRGKEGLVVESEGVSQESE
jgi:mitotic spindle assembly checkpoint protein MAD2B